MILKTFSVTKFFISFRWTQRINLYNLNAIQMRSKFYQMESLFDDIRNLENLFEVEISKKLVTNFNKIKKFP